MRRTKCTILALVITAMVFSPAAMAGENSGKVVDRLFDAYKKGSADEMLAVYSADATFEDINQRHRFTGTEQLQAMLRGIVGFHLQMNLEEKRRLVNGKTLSTGRLSWIFGSRCWRRERIYRTPEETRPAHIEGHRGLISCHDFPAWIRRWESDDLPLGRVSSVLSLVDQAPKGHSESSQMTASRNDSAPMPIPKG